MKHLPKHLRPRWRYLAVELEAWPDADLSRSGFQRSAWFAAQNLVGDAGSADADLRVVEFAFADGVGEALVRARRGEEARARAALACVGEVRGEPVSVAVRGVSGTMRAAEEKYLGRTAEASTDEQVAFDGGERSAVVRGDRVDVRLAGDGVERGDAGGDAAFVGATRRDCE